MGGFYFVRFFFFLNDDVLYFWSVLVLCIVYLVIYVVFRFWEVGVRFVYGGNNDIMK